jgi:hypothetical protein
MANYNGAYTGPQIDAAIAKAQTSLQANDTGWGSYVDTAYTSIAPFAVSANTDTLLPNNKGTVIETQKPADVSTFYTGSVIAGRDGDGMLITLDMKVVPTNAGTETVEIWFDIGGGIGELYRRILTFPKGNGVIRPVDYSVAVYTAATWQTNGASVYIRANNTIDVYDITYLITRTHKALI